MKLSYEERLAQAQEINKMSVKDNMPGQKFPRGARVKVCKEMPPSMSHFDSDFEAIVEYTYAQKFRGDNVDSYSLLILVGNNPINAIAWYYEEQLTLISDDIQAGLKIIKKYENKKSNK